MFPLPFRAPGPSSPEKCPTPKSSRASALALVAPLALLLGALAFPFSPSAHAAPILGAVPTNGQYVAGELLVKFADGPNSATAQQARQKVGASVVNTFNITGWQQLKMPAGLTASKALALIAAQKGVAAVQPNYTYYLDAVPNDPGYPKQYHLPKISAPEAWDVTTSSPEVVVAVIDSGINLTHVDLEDSIVHPIDLTKTPPDDKPDDTNGHGTHCAGLIGAAGNNGEVVSGVDWNVKIMPVRIFGADGGASDSLIIAAYEYVIGEKQRGVNVRIASCSFGGITNSPAEKDALIKLIDAGVLVVAAAGNGNDRGVGENNDIVPHYPSAYDLDGVMSVAASDQDDNPTRFTNYGASRVDIAAPGQDILSTWIGNIRATNTISGTSMSTPIVSGAAALVLSRFPNLSPVELKRRLMATVTKLPQWKGKNAANGRLNVAQAVGGTLSITGTVTGTKLDGSSGPLTDATVTLVGTSGSTTGTSQTTTTDSSGGYSFTELPAGTYTVTATAVGYQAASSSVTISLAGGSVTADLKLTANAATYSISGQVTQVVNGSFVPVEGVQIFADNSADPAAITNSDGNYNIPNRSAGTYSVFALKDGYTFTVVGNSSASSATLVLPTTGLASSPSGTVNFVATAAAPDQEAPFVEITTPEDGSTITYASGSGASITAVGTATDETGIANLFFVLARQQGNKFQYYNWTKRNWTGKIATAGVVLTRNVSGRKEMDWSQALPTLAKGTYVLTVSGRDTLGNESNGSADAVSTFTVAKQSKSKPGKGSAAAS